MKKFRQRTRVIQLAHHLLIGRSRGLIVCACIECGSFIGAGDDLHLLALCDRAHVCKKPAQSVKPSWGDHSEYLKKRAS